VSGYVARRLAAIVALTFGITILVFLIIRLIPGDLPIQVQYLRWIGNVLHGDFGYSYGQQQSVTSLLAANFPATIQLTIAGLALSLLLGTLIGVTAALWRNRGPDTLAMGVALTCMSIPSFWLGLLLILLFAVQLPWFDVVGGTSLKGLVLPAVTLALGGAGFNARFVRSSVIHALVQKHVITARAKGTTRGQVFRRHVLRNALLPVLTVAGIQVGQLLSGTVIVETVFSRPGIGRLLVQAILAKDYQTVQAVVLIIAVLYALANFAVDLLYPVLDPRVGHR